jgi:hypothetical protein
MKTQNDSSRGVILLEQNGSKLLGCFIFVEFGGSLRSGNGLAHIEQTSKTPSDQKIHEHSEQGRPFENFAFDDRRLEDRNEWLGERPAYRIDKAREPSGGIGSSEPQEKTKHQNYLEERRKIPNDLRASEKRFGGWRII